MHAAALCALLSSTSGCLMAGFDPLDDEQAALSPQGGTGNSGGMGSAAGQSGGGSGTGSGGRSGSGGMAGFVPDAGSGTGGSMVTPMQDASVPDSGPLLVTNCTGKDNLEDCEDGLSCTVDDYCFNEVCIGGVTRACGDECNTGSCNEIDDACELTPLPNNTKCGFLDAFTCSNGRCTNPVTKCTEGGECTPTCTNATCNISCPNANSCESSCTNGAECMIDCQGTANCKVSCEDSSCETKCQGSGICEVGCEGSGTSCAIFCNDASGCDQTTCLEGASCVLLCDVTETCGFKDCWAGEQQCGDGKVVCNGVCDP